MTVNLFGGTRSVEKYLENRPVGGGRRSWTVAGMIAVTFTFGILAALRSISHSSGATQHAAMSSAMQIGADEPRSTLGAMRHSEGHRTQRIGWLRAAVLGANDGIVSTASLVVGVAAAQVTHGDLLTAGIAGLVAGAMSMAAGEYVSVSSQTDTEKADLARERLELAADPAHEHEELAGIYVRRGLDPSLAEQVATQMMAHDPVGTHARDELGISDTTRARPVQAALASAGSFAVGAALPLLVAFLAPEAALIPAVAGMSLLFLALLGTLAAKTGGAPMLAGASRVTFWGALAMALTAGVGALSDTVT